MHTSHRTPGKRTPATAPCSGLSSPSRLGETGQGARTSHTEPWRALWRQPCTAGHGAAAQTRAHGQHTEHRTSRHGGALPSALPLRPSARGQRHRKPTDHTWGRARTHRLALESLKEMSPLGTVRLPLFQQTAKCRREIRQWTDTMARHSRPPEPCRRPALQGKGGAEVLPTENGVSLAAPGVAPAGETGKG